MFCRARRGFASCGVHLMNIMKSRFLLLSSIASLGFGLALAETAAQKPETWISPQARAVIERTRAAYAGVENWTMSSVTEARQYFSDDTERPYVWRSEERYLKGAGSKPFYANNIHYDLWSPFKGGPDAPDYAVMQNADSEFRLQRAVKGSLQRTAAPPIEAARPALSRSLEGELGRAQYVRYLGRETVDGRACEVVETMTFRNTPPDTPPVIYSARFYVDASGFIVQRSTAQDAFEKRPGSPADPTGRPTLATWEIERITRYAAKASLTAADFSLEVFEREASALLKLGEVMPETVEQLYRPGDSLPDMGFIGWADQKPFRIADLKGKVVVVETWASWCHFCKEAFPFYEKMRKKLETQDVVFVAVSFDAKVADYEKWMKAHGGEYGFKFGRVDSPDPAKAMKDFRGSLPAFYVLGRDGKIVGAYTGWGYAKGADDPRLLDALRKAGVKP